MRQAKVLTEDSFLARFKDVMARYLGREDAALKGIAVQPWWDSEIIESEPRRALGGLGESFLFP